MNSASPNCNDVINTWLLLTQRAILESSTAAATAPTSRVTISPHLVQFFARLFFQSDAWFLLNNLRLNERSSESRSRLSSLSSSSNEQRCERWIQNNEKPHNNVCFLSQRSPLRGIADHAFEARSRTFHLTRDLMQRLVALRLCAFGINIGEKRLDNTTKQQPIDQFRNFDLLSSTEDDAAATNDDCAVTNTTQRRVLQILLRLRRDILAERTRIGVSEIVATDLAHEVRQLRANYDALLIEATTRYGEWYEYCRNNDAAKKIVRQHDTSIDEIEIDNNSDGDKENLISSRQDTRLIDDTMRSTCRRVSSQQLELSIIDNNDDEKCESEERRDEKSNNGISQNVSRSNGWYFMSTQRWNVMTEVDRLFSSAEQLHSLLLHTNNSVRLLVQQQTIELERTLTAEEERREITFALQKDALLAEEAATKAQVTKLRELVEQTSLIERISSDVRSIINRVTLSLSEELKRQRARNQSLTTDHQNANRRTLHIIQILTHEQTGQSEVPALTREYISRVTYPRVVDCSDLRELRNSICWNNCLNMLRWARPELRRDRELVRKDKIVAVDEHQMPDIQGYMSANEMRDALVACLYFYGGNETFLSTIERLYEYMHKPANRDSNIKDIYASSVIFKLLLAQRHNNDRVTTHLYEGLAIVRAKQLDLRSIPQTLFKAIIMIFRHRMNLHNHLVSSTSSPASTGEVTATSIVEPEMSSYGATAMCAQ